MRIDEWRALLVDVAGEMSASSEDASVEEPDELVPYNPAQAPTAAILVDLLQAFRSLKERATPSLVALVVSAWDTVQATAVGLKAPAPEEWVAERLPLLAQFLAVNTQAFSSRVYGVSAQGGDVRDPAEVARLLEFLDPERRIVVVGPDSAPAVGPHDLSAPVRWAIFGEGEV
jgi:hypothetical protein